MQNIDYSDTFHQDQIDKRIMIETEYVLRKNEARNMVGCPHCYSGSLIWLLIMPTKYTVVLHEHNTNKIKMKLLE